MVAVTGSRKQQAGEIACCFSFSAVCSLRHREVAHEGVNFLGHVLAFQGAVNQFGHFGHMLFGHATGGDGGRADPDANGRWSCVISLGSPDPSEDGPYMAIAVLVDGSTARSFREYVTNELPNDDRDGMAEYPTTEDLRMASIPLQRDITLDDPSLQDEQGSCAT